MDKKDRKILVVDDEPNIVKALVFTLKKHGYETFEAIDGETALDIVQKESPDLVLLDVMIPYIDGYEVCKRIKGDPKTKQIHVIMLTATRIQTIDSDMGFECGADEYILKPFSLSDVMSRVGELLQ
ncbi:MAG: response regulator [bacterium]